MRISRVLHHEFDNGDMALLLCRPSKIKRWYWEYLDGRMRMLDAGATITKRAALEKVAHINISYHTKDGP